MAGEFKGHLASYAYVCLAIDSFAACIFFLTYLNHSSSLKILILVRYCKLVTMFGTSNFLVAALMLYVKS